MKSSQKILDLLSQKSEDISFSELSQNLDIHESTLARNLEKLIESGDVKKKSVGKNTFYSLGWTQRIRSFLKKDFFSRPKVGYNPEFLRGYVPNITSFLGKHLGRLTHSLDSGWALTSYDYQTHLRMIETLLIDLSYASSKLEGNTYSYLDTEVLIKYGESAEGKTALETQMILNHKYVLKYIIDEKNNIWLNKKTFFELHTLLGKDILHDSQLGVIRSNPVKIWASSYTPLESQIQLECEFAIFIDKLSQIVNPFEQSLFILVFIPYFQLFFDINKRTSRISCNIPLIQHWLPPLSLLQVSERDYIDAILWVYELSDVSLLAEIYTDNYLLNLERYI